MHRFLCATCYPEVHGCEAPDMGDGADFFPDYCPRCLRYEIVFDTAA